jgi:hypothetical protein
MTDEWWRQPVRFFQHLLREVDAEGINAERLIEEVRAMRAGAYIVMGGGFSAWYPSKLPSQRVNPHLKGDFLGEVVAAAQRAGIKVIVRMDISKGRPEWLARDPEWFVRKADGSPRLVWEMPQTCPTGPYWQEQAFAILAEILGRYQVDGFFFNYLNVARCYCARCQAAVRAATGAPVPPDGTRTPAHERWRQATMADYLLRLRAFIRERAPSAVLIPYHHVRDGWNYRAMAEGADIVSAQASIPLVVNPVDPQPQWNHWAAEEALAARSVKPRSAPVLIHTGSEFFASRQTALPPDRMVRGMIQAAAHGANAAASLNGTLDQDDPRTIPRLREFADYLHRNSAWYRGLRSLAGVALVRSQDSMDWGPDAGRPAGDVRTPGHVAEFRGLYEAIVESRHACDIAPTGGLTLAALRRYQVLFLPAVSCMSADDAAVLDDYVDAGGHLVLTADSGACEQDGVSRITPALRCLPYLPGPSRNVFGGYLKSVNPHLRAALGGVPHIGIDSDFWSPVGAGGSEGATVDLRLVSPARNNAPEFTAVPATGVEPGLMHCRFGRGVATWLPWRIGALFHLSGIPEYASLVRHLLAEVLGESVVRTDAPPAVECIFYGHPEGEVVHFLNGAATQTKPLVRNPPLAGFSVRVRSAASQAQLLNTGQALATERDGADIVFRLDRLDCFAAVALTNGGSLARS